MQHLPTVLLVEDDRNIANALQHALRSSYELDVAGDGAAAFQKTNSNSYDIIVLDLNLPDMSGLDICKQLRTRGVTAPILVLSADSNVLTKINLLDTGANDYLTKPFSLGELKARLRAATRVGQPVTALRLGTLRVGGIELNRETYEVSRDDAPIQLRRKEFALLECLMEHAGTVVTRDTLSRIVWQGRDSVWTNTVDVHIKYLRDKIDRPFNDKMVQTVHGRGYKIDTTKAILTTKL